MTIQNYLLQFWICANHLLKKDRTRRLTLSTTLLRSEFPDYFGNLKPNWYNRYILDKVSGPLLRESRAHYDIAFSCVTYLNSAFCFYEHGPSDEVVRTRVAKGFHGLHNYANEYWFQHLLLCSRDFADLDERDLMDAALETLLTQFWKGQPGIAAQSLKLDDTTTANEICKELSSFDDFEHLRQMGTDIQTFRAHLVQEKHAHEVAESMPALKIQIPQIH